jgi:outer membrane lipoprotein-sorting protein
MNVIRFSMSLAFFPIAAMMGMAQQPTGREIMERYKVQDRTQDASITFTMTLMDARGGTRERQVTQVTKTDANDTRKQLIRFLSPADVKGTGFLSIEHGDRDDDRWLYLPALRKSRRIAGSDKTDRFMGSEFAYEDLDAENLRLYRYERNGSENIDGVEAWIITATPTDFQRREETGYSKRELWVSQDHFLILQMKYYDKEGRYVKLFKTGDIRLVRGTEKWRAYTMTMEDVRKGDKTVITISDYVVDQGVHGELFSERFLKRGK